MSLHLVIRGAPVSTTNSRRIVTRGRGGRPFTIKSQAYAEWSASAIQQLTEANPGRGRIVFTKAIAVTLRVFRARNIGDLDNYIKGVGDSLQRSFWVEDDKLIKTWHVYDCGVCKDDPRIEIEIEAHRAVA